MMDNKFIQQGLQLIKKAEAAYLTTIDENGFPCTRAMLNLRNGTNFPHLVDFMAHHDADLSLFFTTNTSSTKVSQLLTNQKVSVYYCDPLSWHGFMCQGEMELVTDKAIKDAMWIDAWTMYYPEGKESDDYAILRLKPSFVKSYYQFQQSEAVL